MTESNAKKKLWLAFGAGTFLFLLGVAVVRQTSSSLVAGLELAPHATGTVTCAWDDPGGGIRTLPAQSTASGHVSFRIPPKATLFRFVFSSAQQPYQIKAFSLYGLSLFNAQWLNNMVNQETPVYTQQYMGRHDTLEIAAAHGKDTSLAYPRFFTLLLQLFRIAQKAAVPALAALYAAFLGVLLLLRQSHRMPLPTLSRAKERLQSLAQKPAVLLSAIAVTALLTLPPPVHPITGGCDPSWVWLINHMAFNPAGIGESFFFTYGPLGFLLVPQPLGYNVTAALICNIVYALIYSSILATCAFRFPNARKALCCLLACALVLPSSEWRWFVPVYFSLALCCHLPAGQRGLLAAFSALAGFLIVFVSLIKFTLAIVSGLCLILVIAYLALFARRKLVVFLLPFVAALLATLLLARALLFSSPQAMRTWLAVSWEIAAGYNSAMVTQASAVDLLIPFAFLASYLWLILPLRHCTLVRVAQLAVLSPVIFFAFKYSITRAGAGFIRTVVYVLPCTTALLAVFADPAWKPRIVKLLTVQFAAGWTVLLFTGFFLQLSLTGASLKNLCDTVLIGRSVERAKALSGEALRSLRLPDDWCGWIGTNTFSSYPVELIYAPANKLKLVPFPILQGYSAYTKALDTRGARLFECVGGPDWLLCTFDTPDMRNNVIDTPAVWNAIRANYQPAAAEGKKVLMRRRAAPTPAALEPIETRTVSAGGWIDVQSPEAGALYLSVDWRPTLLGKLAPLFWRNTQNAITIERMTGERRRWRFVPNTAQTPFPVDQIPFNDREFVGLLTQPPNAALRMKRLKLSCESPAFFEKTLTITLYRATPQRSAHP